MDGSLTLRERRNLAVGVTEAYLQGLLDRGTGHFQERNYHAALECFNQAIEQDVETPLTILDKRAATHIKLEDLNSALSDAGKIVRRHQTKAVGYLRLGQVLQLQRKPEKALKIYEKGLRTASHQDTHFKVIQQSHNKLSASLAPRHAIDPFKTLPVEITVMLLALLDFKDIVTLSRVSRAWRDIIIKDPSAWTILDFSTSRRSVSMRTVRTYVKRAHGKVKRFVSGRASSNQEAIIFYIANRCKVLQELRLGSCLVSSCLLKATPGLSSLRSLILSPMTEITLDTAIEVLVTCKSLECAEFPKIRPNILQLPLEQESSLPNLRTLTFDQGVCPKMMLSVSQLVTAIPNVRSLRVRNWIFNNEHFDAHGFSELAFLEHLDLSACQMEGIPLFPSSIQTLLMAGWLCSLPTSPTQQLLPNLQRLSIANSKQLTLLPQSWLDIKEGNLLELNLTNVVHDDFVLRPWIEGGQFCNLESLSLRGSVFNDDLAESLVQHAKHIKSLDLGWTQITGVGVKALVKGLGNTLRYLNLDSCLFTKLDAVQWARASGLTVQYEFNFTAGKGRKAR